MVKSVQFSLSPIHIIACHYQGGALVFEKQAIMAVMGISGSGSGMISPKGIIDLVSQCRPEIMDAVGEWVVSLPKTIDITDYHTRLYDAIKAAGEAGLSMTDISRKIQGKATIDRDTALADMVGLGYIKMVSSGMPGRRPAIRAVVA